MSDAGQQSPNGNAETPAAPGGSEHLNIKVTDGNNEVFFKIKRTTKLEKLMKAFCERQGRELRSARFLFEGTKVQATDTPADVSSSRVPPPLIITAQQSIGREKADRRLSIQLDMADGDSIEVHQEQIGGAA